MSLPGATVTARTTRPPSLAAADSSVWFVAGITQKGPQTPVALQSIDDYVAQFGIRESYGMLYDALDAYFHEGGSKAVVARVVGPTPVLAAHTFLTGTSTNAIIVSAKSYGDWGNLITVAIVAGVGGGTYQVQVLYNAVVVEQSGDLTTQADAVAWSAGSQYVNITLGNGSAAPAVVAATALTGGTDDHANATDTQWATALATFSKDLGPGQVSMPGRSTATAHSNLIAHAVAKNRTAILDFVDTGDRATLVTAAALDRLVSGSDSAAGFAPWAVIPGLTVGLTRTVPYSAIAAGIMARNDTAGVSQNQPSAGPNFGEAVYAIGLSQLPWSGVANGDRELLNNAGVNVARILGGTVTTYGYRTLADPTNVNTLLLLSNRRLVMEIVAKAQAIGDSYVFDQIDGRGLLFADFNGDLVGMLQPYFTEGSLFGTTAAEAFSVDTGPNVNTAVTEAALQLNAILALKLSPFAEQVPIQIVSTPEGI